ncbi:MAG: hydratase, partial [Clostridia bacterium]|nr:hydratase [Clostridia bacterium]
IAATAAIGGVLTSAEELDCWGKVPEYHFDKGVYEKRVYNGYNKATGEDLVYGPNIKDWPDMSPLADNILLKVCSKIMDPVTTTDELIPSGETSSFRSNPVGLAEFSLSRRDPEYVGRSKVVDKLEKARVAGGDVLADAPELAKVFETIRAIPGQADLDIPATELGSMVYAVKPGDGSAREQAASCQRVIGGLANITKEYATKRYRSNVMNWGMLPFQMDAEPDAFDVGDYIYVPGIRKALDDNALESIKAYVIKDGAATELDLYITPMTENEREIVKAGCLINFNRNRKQ